MFGASSAIFPMRLRRNQLMKETSNESRYGPWRGVECDQCGCTRLRVIYTRRRWDGTLVRRRECRSCRNRITTWEYAGK